MRRGAGTGVRPRRKAQLHIVMQAARQPMRLPAPRAHRPGVGAASAASPCAAAAVSTACSMLMHASGVPLPARAAASTGVRAARSVVSSGVVGSGRSCAEARPGGLVLAVVVDRMEGNPGQKMAVATARYALVSCLCGDLQQQIRHTRLSSCAGRASRARRRGPAKPAPMLTCLTRPRPLERIVSVPHAKAGVNQVGSAGIGGPRALAASERQPSSPEEDSSSTRSI